MIRLDIPGFGLREISVVLTDYTGTHSCGGTVRDGVKERLAELAGRVDVHVLTADTFGTVARELGDLPISVEVLSGRHLDEQKRAFALEWDPACIAALGNGKNDRLLLRAVRDGGGLAIAVDNGEGCAVDAVLASDLLVHGSENALDLLLDTNRSVATLRF